VKYSDEQSEVEITVENTPAQLSVSVLDRGHGIRSQDLARVFERFYRTDKARSRELGGTGLGLAIVKHIARLHGGEVQVESALGEGSVFTLTIPQEGARDESQSELR
jgi:two-component system phosphate regulon sensor histidine kinase PhoR